MGLSTKKTKSTSTATTTPNVPDWLAQPAQGFGTALQGFQAQGPEAYTPELSTLQGQAFTNAGALKPNAGYDDAAGMVKGADTTFDPGNVQGESLLSGLDQYFTPYRDKVLNPVLADYDEQSGKTRAAQAASGARNGAFGGSRFALREGQTEGELARGRASTEGSLLSDMFSQATSLSGQDAARRQAAAEGNAGRGLTAQTAGTSAQLQAGGLLSNIAGAQGADNRSNIDLQDKLGGEQTDFQTKIKQFPIEYQQALEGLFSGINPGLFTGQTVNSTGTGKTSGSVGSFLADYLIGSGKG